MFAFPEVTTAASTRATPNTQGPRPWRWLSLWRTL